MLRQLRACLELNCGSIICVNFYAKHELYDMYMINIHEPLLSVNFCVVLLSIRSDHDGEFQNERFEHLCEKHGIKHNFFAPRTPQQNGVVERKNRSLEELARTMLNENSLPNFFWADAVNTTCCVFDECVFLPSFNV